TRTLTVSLSVTSPGASMGTVGYINNVAAGQSSTAIGDFDTAIEAGKKVVDLDPSFPRAHEELEARGDRSGHRGRLYGPGRPGQRLCLAGKRFSRSQRPAG